jgi:cobalt/nickel transport system permease protein
MTPGDSIFMFIYFSDQVNLFGLRFSSLSITSQGVFAFLFFVVKVGTIISLTTLLTLTTRWADILKSLRAFGVPFIFVLVLSLTYQYIFILLRIVQDMHLARKSRTIKRKKYIDGTKEERNWVANRIGTTFLRSRMMSEETYLAMISRGFDGEVKTDNPYSIRRTDCFFVFSSISLLISLIILRW